MITLPSILHSIKNIVEDEFECPICLEPLSDSLITPRCNHRFCASCLESSLKRNSSCPSCRLHIASTQSCTKDLTLDRIIRRLIDELIDPLESQINFGIAESDEKCLEKLICTKRKNLSEGPNRVQFAIDGNKQRSKRSRTTKDEELNILCDPEILDEEQEQVCSQRSERHFKDESFDKKIKELLAFKTEFGHVDVSPHFHASYASLGRWVSVVRCANNHVQKGNSSQYSLTPRQIQRLNMLGFTWNMKLAAFDTRFKELVAFKNKHGHCIVPTKSTSDNQYLALGRWVLKLRHRYKKCNQDGKLRGQICTENIRRLEHIGFVWNVYKPRG